MEKKKGTGIRKWGILTGVFAVLLVALIIVKRRLRISEACGS